MAQIYSLEQVSTHNTVDDLWLVIDGKVYDVTSFIDEHPGGEEVLTDCGGRDATTEFEDVGHSDEAVEKLKPLYIGDLDPSELKVSHGKAPKFTTQSSEAKVDSDKSPLTYLILAALIAAGGFFYIQLQKANVQN